jgi:hypothetical protein
MKEEYNYTLTVPLGDIDEALPLMEELKGLYPQLRLSRKPDTPCNARFYLCFPFKGVRTDLPFQQWIGPRIKAGWDLFGPNYGIWGLK